LAFAFGAIAQRLRIPPLVGYLLAGVAVGPFPPGFVADQGPAGELAELGVILLMFGVGLHFSLNDLLSVRGIALPGAIVQIAAATCMGLALALSLGWTAPVSCSVLPYPSPAQLSCFVPLANLFGASNASLTSDSVASYLGLNLVGLLALTVAKAAVFVSLMLIVGRRIIPWVLRYIAHTGSPLRSRHRPWCCFHSHQAD